ncbi:MAG: undecaprenyldiphospho-muramoylpentapeptide beta-N-acetylglucosaminyltransferase [Aeromicrobium sp.]|jgi:UDP-N-acetylglucosamine--N-acetylmuramyl-(pentapeptide) pyrophosphoryl-undecaprenol N-acetylglucosamine transferase|nr:MAG: undecaprenyldiphospho-muramoylpentapeptide beta-N-acetylglucosaminyltransferase [Aeromicrobium sp.]
MRVLMAGGGTAGHTSPLLATAAVLTESGDEICCLGTTSGLEVTLIPQAGYRLEFVPRVPMPRRLSLDLLKLPFRLLATIRAARRVIDEFRPDVVVGFGGYVSVPAYIAARRRSIPFVVHEGNALAGLANRLGARLTRFVATSFPDTDLRHAQYLGLPIRQDIADLDRHANRTLAREFFGLAPDAPTIVVTGGSQGARRLNTAMSDAAPALAKAGIQVLHAAGRTNEVEVESNPDENAPAYVVKEFIDRMDLAYAAGDLIVCRAGANTVTEVAAVGLPAVFVPLPIGNGEQALNADPVVAAGGGVLIDDAAFTSAWVENALIPMVSDREQLDRMSSAASGVVHRDAAQRLAAMIHGAGE